MLAGVDSARLEHHLESPQGFRRHPAGAVAGAAGGAACGDRIEVRLTVERDRVVEAGFDASGCGTALAAGSAAVALSRGRDVLDVALIGPPEIAAELGGLSPGKLHAADLASDALHRALGVAVREHAALAPSGGTLVAMSGGVDSAVAALLLGRASHCVAVTLELWADPENDAEGSCCSASAVRSARALAHELRLPHLTLDLRDEFRAGVVEPFIAGYAAGETPNPCVRCNGHVRLDAMLALADRLGCGQLATGHYARIDEVDDPAGPLLALAADPAKDQTYMLAALDPTTLARMRFPLGGLHKREVRRIATDARLAVASNAESQDLCFLAGTDRRRFLARHGGMADRPGEIVDRAGAVLGRHRGHHHFTVGQRKGIKVASNSPLYVVAKDARSNRVLVGPREELRCTHLAVRGARLHRAGRRVDRVKLRYRSRPLGARLIGDPQAGNHRTLTIDLRDPADAAAPGQLACLMDGELVVGWGTIAPTLPPR
jgi:tRNA-specific 2-thiouridylase